MTTNAIPMALLTNLNRAMEWVDNTHANVKKVHAAITRRTLLMEACKQGRIDIVKILIKSGVDINAKDHFGNTALMEAAYYGRLEIAKLLIENGAAINSTTVHGSTAIQMATIRGYTEIVRLLLRHHARLFTRGETELNIAFRHKHTDIIRLLIQAGLRPKSRNMLNANNITRNIVARSIGQRRALKLLLIPKIKLNNINKKNNMFTGYNFKRGNIVVELSNNKIRPLYFLPTSFNRYFGTQWRNNRLNKNTKVSEKSHPLLSKKNIVKKHVRKVRLI
jgi:ankyrin repeat protein